MKARKGFLLFEIMISVVIIASGLLFIMNSYSSAKNSIKRSTELFEASLLLENKMWEFEEKGEIEIGAESGDFPENEEYSWSMEAGLAAEAAAVEVAPGEEGEAPGEEKGITDEADYNLVTLEVFAKKKPETIRYSLVTYLKNKTE